MNDNMFKTTEEILEMINYLIWHKEKIESLRIFKPFKK